MIIKKLSIILLFLAMPLFVFSAEDNDTTKAITNALANIKRKGDNVMPMMVPTLDHLIKTYKIDLNIDKQKKSIIAGAKGNEAVFMRSFDNNLKAPESQIKAMTGIDKITATALYCDCYGLPDDFFSNLNDMAYSAEYGLTHAVLALSIIEQRKCKYDTAAFSTAKITLTPLLEKLIRIKKPTSDIGIEAVVMLYISGNGNRVKNEWIEDIINAQQADGGWESSDHTTVLALWALLEANKYTIKP